MAASDLTTLAAVKVWLGRTGDTNSDAQFSALITAASRTILSYLQRPIILPHSVTEIRDGTGASSMVLKQWPVVGVSSLIAGNMAVPAAAAPSALPQPSINFGVGYVLEQWDGAPPGRPQTLSMRGYSFGCQGFGVRNAQNVQIVYQAGYQVTAEAQTVVGGLVTVNGPYGAWTSDGGVTYANGTALAKAVGAPTVGQYALGSTAGTYVFNAADNGQGVLITYGFVPSDLADACMELVAERFKYSERIAERTHSLGGNETVSYDTVRMTPLIASMLQPYKNVLPI